MSSSRPVQPIQPGEGYDIDSSAFDSEDEREGEIPSSELDQLVEEAEDGFSSEDVEEMRSRLKEVGLVTFLRDYLNLPTGGVDDEMPSLRKLLLGFGIIPPKSLRDPSTPNLALLPFTKLSLSRILRQRKKLPQYNTMSDAIRLLRTRKNIIVLTGAGISTSCGIPDFRSSEGLYAKLREEGKYELDDPQQMFDIGYFREHPEVFYSFAKKIYPSNFTPSPCHRWIKLLEDKGLLLRNYTQNIDTLESQAGVSKVLQCHGSFKTASCLRCKTRVPGTTIEPYIMSQTIPYCPLCKATRAAEFKVLKVEEEARRKAQGKGKSKSKGKGWDEGSEEEEEESEWGKGEPALMKPDITFFGQALDFEFDECLFKDREKVDLLVIIGTSLKVAPVSEVLTHIPHSVPQIYINNEPVLHFQPDICLIGDADYTVKSLSRKLGWTIPPPPTKSDSVPNMNAEELKEKEKVWLSGTGDLAHMHFLSNPADLRPTGETESEASGSSGSAGGSGESDDESGSTSSLSEPESVDQATLTSTTVTTTSMSKTTSSVQTSDLGEDERPTKRVKVELKVEVEDKVIVSKLI